MTKILCMSADWKNSGVGPRGVARIKDAGEYAGLYENPTVYFAATHTPKYPDLLCMASSMHQIFFQLYPNVPAVELTGDEEWSSRGEFRKFFARVQVGETVVLVSGSYHLERLKIVVAKYHPEHAPYVKYEVAKDDRPTLLMRAIEIPKLWLLKMPEHRQQKLRVWQQRWLRFLPV